MGNNRNSKVVQINSCSFCGRNLKDEWKFCPFCKSHVDTFICIFCGLEVKAHWNYCPHCKNEVKSEFKNRQRLDKCNEWLNGVLKSEKTNEK